MPCQARHATHAGSANAVHDVHPCASSSRRSGRTRPACSYCVQAARRGLRRWRASSTKALHGRTGRDARAHTASAIRCGRSKPPDSTRHTCITVTAGHRAAPSLFQSPDELRRCSTGSRLSAVVFDRQVDARMRVPRAIEAAAARGGRLRRTSACVWAWTRWRVGGGHGCGASGNGLPISAPPSRPHRHAGSSNSRVHGCIAGRGGTAARLSAFRHAIARPAWPSTTASPRAAGPSLCPGRNRAQASRLASSRSMRSGASAQHYVAAACTLDPLSTARDVCRRILLRPRPARSIRFSDDPSSARTAVRSASPGPSDPRFHHPSRMASIGEPQSMPFPGRSTPAARATRARRARALTAGSIEHQQSSSMLAMLRSLDRAGPQAGSRTRARPSHSCAVEASPREHACRRPLRRHRLPRPSARRQRRVGPAAAVMRSRSLVERRRRPRNAGWIAWPRLHDVEPTRCREERCIPHRVAKQSSAHSRPRRVRRG